MYPEIKVGHSDIPTFSLCVIAGVLAMFLIAAMKLRKKGCASGEFAFLVPRLFIALGFAFSGAMLFDSLVNIPTRGTFVWGGMTFYGGVTAAIGAFTLSVYLFRKKTSLTTAQWLDLMTIPLLVFHALGRLGCFAGGCCYGAETDGAFGLVFPDQPEHGIFHGGKKVYPTQLFEAAGLVVLAVILVIVKKHDFAIYAVAYPVMRFLLEFLRGDERGVVILSLSPSQWLSVLILATALATLTVHFVKKRTSIDKSVLHSDFTSSANEEISTRQSGER